MPAPGFQLGVRRLLRLISSSERSRVRLGSQAPLIGNPLWRRGCWLLPSSWPFCATHRAIPTAQALLSVCRHSTPLHAASGGPVKGPVACPRGPAPILDQTALASFLVHLQALGAVDVGDQLALERRSRAGFHSANNHQAPARPQSCPSHSFLGVSARPSHRVRAAAEQAV